MYSYIFSKGKCIKVVGITGLYYSPNIIEKMIINDGLPTFEQLSLYNPMSLIHYKILISYIKLFNVNHISKFM